MTDEAVKARDAIEAGIAALSAPDVNGSHASVASGLLEVAMWAVGESARLRADAQSAVALVVEKAAKTMRDMDVPAEWTHEGAVWRRCLNSASDVLLTLADTDGLAMVEALRKERDDALDAARQQDALRGATLATMRSVSADLATAQAQIEALSDALEELKQWADAYPTKVFPEPDLARAAAILSQGGMSLDVIAASNMRHVLTRVAQITRSALAALPAKEGE
jgi:hypothetical protein